MTGTVVVFGATSYVGGWVIPRLLEDGYRVVGVSRRPNLARIFLPEESDRFAIAGAEEAAKRCEGAPFSIVNLAYVTATPPHRRFREDRRLARSIGGVAAQGCRRIVHISTAAVFGYRFSKPPTPVRVRWRPMDSLYAESKIRAEHLIERLGRKVGCEAVVVRLGNVIGPGSPAWVARPAQRIMEMQPLCYEGAQGFSNTTHVENVAHYVNYLLGQPAGAPDDFATYHHLAEFSSHRWPELFDVMSDAIGAPWTTVRPFNSRGRAPGRRRVLGAVYDTPLGGYVRAMFSHFPESETVDRWVAKKRAPRPSESGGPVPIGADDHGLLELFSTAIEFRSSTMDGWQPKLGFSSACAGIADWLRSSGYRLR